MSKQITGVDYSGRRCVLVDDVTLQSVKLGDQRKTSRGESFIVVGGAAPHKPGSTGKVDVAQDTESMATQFYPGVVGCKWERI